MEDLLFTTKARAEKRGRYVVSSTQRAEIAPGEVVGVGIIPGKGESALVHEFGAAQASLPMHAVATAIASGTVIPFPALVSAVAETGQLDALKKALAAHK